MLWNLNDFVCIKTIKAHSGVIETLSTVQCDGKVYLASGSSDKTLKIWDLQNDSAIKTIDNEYGTTSSRVFMNGDKACIAIGDNDGKIKLWME